MKFQKFGMAYGSVFTQQHPELPPQHPSPGSQQPKRFPKKLKIPKFNMVKIFNEGEKWSERMSHISILSNVFIIHHEDLPVVKRTQISRFCKPYFFVRNE